MSGGAWWMAGRSSLYDGLVHAWPLTGSANDAITGAASSVVGVTYAAGHLGTAAQFAGAGSTIATTGASPLGAASRSVAFWFKKTAEGGFWFDCGAQSGNNRLVIYSTALAGIKISTQAVDVLTTPALSLDVYHFAAVTYDGTTVRAYVNGAAPVSANITLTTTSEVVRLGSNTTGSLEQVLLANRVWTAGELASLAAGRPFPF